MIDAADARVQSICQVLVGGRCAGTGWVLSGKQVMTAAHVVADVPMKAIAREKIQLRFPCGLFDASVDESQIDWAHDAAVLNVENLQALLPRPLPVAPIPSARDSMRWDSWGFPQKVNPSGFAIGGTVAAVNVPAGNGAKLLQLELAQWAKELQGASGGPILIGEACTGFVGRYPTALPIGTIFATAIGDLKHLVSVRLALAESLSYVPEDLDRFLALQTSWADDFPQLRLGWGSATSAAFVERTLVARDGHTGSTADLAQLLGPVGTLLEGDAGSGKSRLIGEALLRMTRSWGALGFAGRPIPMLLAAADVAAGTGFFERLTSQPRYPQSELDAPRLRELTSAGRWQWIFLVDAVDEAVYDEASRTVVERMLKALDAFCRERGHKWMAARRTNTTALRLPPGTHLLGLANLSAAQRSSMVAALARPGLSGPPSDSELPPAILGNPLLLGAALQLRRVRGKTMHNTPAGVLSEFLACLMEEAQRRTAAPTEFGGSWRAVSLLESAGHIAAARGDADDVTESTATWLAEEKGLGLMLANRAADTLIRKVLPAIGIVRMEGSKLAWSHALYRDTLAALSMANAGDAQRIAKRVDQAVVRGDYAAAAIALVLADGAVNPVEVLDSMELHASSHAVVEFLKYGGTLDEQLLATFIGYLDDEAHGMKQLWKTCTSVLAVTFSPIEALLALSHLAGARDALRGLMTDVMIHEDLRREIEERLAVAVQTRGAPT